MGKRKAIRTEYLIVGNSAGGIGAAEAIRDVDRTKSIMIVSEEPYLVYSRPLISKYLAGERGMDEILFRPADFYSKNSIELVVGKKVNSLDLNSQTAQLESGEQITWQKLLLATGGKPIVPDVKGGEKYGIFTFLTIENAIEISSYIKHGFHAVVIGGGLIGVSASEALVKRGISVTIVEMKDRILNTILDETASSIAEEALKKAGVSVITSQTVAEVIGDRHVEGVVLDSGEKISCNLVVMAIGVSPRTELVTDTDIEVNRGIVIDRYMSTTHPNVYACGDAAEAYDFVYDTNRVTPIWPNAYIGGRVAGYNMAGVRTEYSGGTAMNSLNYFGLDIATAGVLTPPPGNGWEVISQRNDGTYRKIILNHDLVKGMVFVGDIEKSGIVVSLMKDKVSVASLKQSLMADNFGLAYLPRETWQERLGKASVPRNSQ